MDIDRALLGRRVQFIANQDFRFVGITGVLEVDYDDHCYAFRIDRPLPFCCRDYEDSRAGYLLLLNEGLANITFIGDEIMIHEGQLENADPTVRSRAEALLTQCNPATAYISFLDAQGTERDLIEVEGTITNDRELPGVIAEMLEYDEAGLVEVLTFDLATWEADPDAMTGPDHHLALDRLPLV